MYSCVPSKHAHLRLLITFLLIPGFVNLFAFNDALIKKPDNWLFLAKKQLWKSDILNK